jgi:hypothetical protein
MRYRHAMGRVAIFILAAAGLGAEPAPIDPDKLLAAIAQVESGVHDGAVGRAGERSRYQMSESVWRKFSTEPFIRADDPAQSRAVALDYLAWIESQLRRRGTEATPYSLSLAWNAGVAGAEHPSPRAKDYAERVAALYRADAK